MATYTPPQQRLHREFLYLDHDTVINSLSALEAGKVDEIIQKVNDSSEGNLAGGLQAGPLRASGGKRKNSSMQEELVRTRTRFSAFDSWYSYLRAQQGIGSFSAWTPEIRDELGVGHTIEFEADVELAPIHKLLRTFLAFAGEATKAHSPFHQSGKELQETKKIARQVSDWMGGEGRSRDVPIYMAPNGVTEPKIVARLDERYMIRPAEALEGSFTVIGQVEQLVASDATVSAIRILRDVPPTPMETQVINEAMMNFIEPAQQLGVHITEDDIGITAPAVILRPIALFR